ncbi:MAG: hypothetical protein ACI857_001526 [Arenicella sp.]|jgi:uncharacterized protein (DUF1330 family)
MSDTKSILVINAIINKANMAELPAYLGAIGPIFGKNGGSPLGKYKGAEQISGEDGPDIISVMQFPNAEAIKTAVNSDEFKALAELRARVFSKLNLTICEEM